MSRTGKTIHIRLRRKGGKIRIHKLPMTPRAPCATIEMITCICFRDGLVRSTSNGVRFFHCCRYSNSSLSRGAWGKREQPTEEGKVHDCPTTPPRSRFFLSSKYKLPAPRSCPKNTCSHEQYTLLVRVAGVDGLVVVVDGQGHLVAVQGSVSQEVVLEAQRRLLGNLPTTRNRRRKSSVSQ